MCVCLVLYLSFQVIASVSLLIFCFSFYSVNPAPNKEQDCAIRHIVAGTSRPAPYIVFGPPGTGKTYTIVEAIKQVCRKLK